jgi:endonuclease-3
MAMNRDMLSRLRKAYPRVRKTALHHTNPLELLVATILSAQTTDVLVNRVTPALFKKYRTARDYAEADIEELRAAIGSVNFYRNKGKYIKESCRIIVEDYGGQVPDTMEELVKLPGVSRKTANVVLGNVYGKAEGVVVDTHVMRLAGRLGLSDEKNREKIERDLMKKFPRDQWIDLANLLIVHGRQVCTARAPRCDACVLRDVCPYFRDVVAPQRAA